ncbi:MULTISPECIES: hypothetical protein [Streptomyces]|uniref:HEAT repeat domain-containing protein n=1 Tax=Streptomyces luteosporeus TaxID=173856 RepID=A0ABN3TZK9_9ACTN
MPSPASASRDLENLAALWSLGALRAAHVVDAACDALLAGLDSPTLRMLAACTTTEADYEVAELLPATLDELGLTFFPRGSQAGKEAAARALATRTLTGAMSPRQLAFQIHQLFGHELDLTARLAAYDDEYDVLGYGDRTAAQVDADVLAEARRIARSGMETALAAASSPSWSQRARAGHDLAPFADVPEAAEALTGLLLDAEDTAVTRQTAEALARAGTAAAVRLIALAVAKADDSQAEWMQTGVQDALAGPAGAPDLAAICRRLAHHPEEAVRRGAAEVLAWTGDTSA